MMEDHATGGTPWDTWMAAAQDGDRAAYRRLLRAVAPYVRAIAVRSFVPPAEVEDAVQDVLIAVHEARGSYDPARPFRPWLAGIARHRIIDRARLARRRAAREVPFGPEHERIAQAEAPPVADPAGLLGAITRLPATQRLAIERLKLQEQSLRRVAGDTGLSIGALKVATHRGMRRLRLLLAGERTA